MITKRNFLDSHVYLLSNKLMKESIIEKALLEAEQLEETMKSNAKEILSSTMNSVHVASDILYIPDKKTILK